MINVIKALALSAVAAAAFALPAQAVEGRMGQVNSCSKLHAGKCATGSVRTTTLGKQVRLPGGTWVDCAGDCQDKLRVKTVDFWKEQMLNNN
jgi:hypothetical protein